MTNREPEPVLPREVEYPDTARPREPGDYDLEPSGIQYAVDDVVIDRDDDS
jgi:hypothetical protein